MSTSCTEDSSGKPNTHTLFIPLTHIYIHTYLEVVYIHIMVTSFCLKIESLRLGYARISHGGLTDTELQVGKFRLPDYQGELDNEEITYEPQEVPPWTHFPDTLVRVCAFFCFVC